MQPIRILPKSLATASSTCYGVFSSAAGSIGPGSSLSTFNSSLVLDTARRIIVWGSTSVATPITITGLSETGQTISETIFGSTTTNVATETTQDFIQVTQVSISTAGVTSTGWYVGTSSHGGTPWKQIDNTRSYPYVSFYLNPSSSQVLASFEYTFDDILTYPWINATSTSTGVNWRSGAPYPVISSLGSSVSSGTNGFLNFAPNAWRVTMTSSAAGAGIVTATVIQSG
jgi:hypothetical protein